MADEKIQVRISVTERWFSGLLAYPLYIAFRIGLISEDRACQILTASYRIRVEP